ncbi:unnamed protein product [Triticum turgidum subsp. durum]|uniref:CASP-like protein n=1 Tax=Triticum turgidum subsp. durum TaxID=4567 RepID=A0A9R0WCD0_TRITD|nr:unnamed protein product [Triticum turgidum subsp. durum]
MAMVTADASAAADAATKQPEADKDYSSYNGASTAGVGGGARRGGGGGVVESVVARWKREDMLDKCPLALHAAAAAFAFVALVLVASNQHGDWMQFDRYQEYMYLLAIAALAFAYSLAQALRHAHRMRGGADPISAPSARLFDFIADQASCFDLLVCSCYHHFYLLSDKSSCGLNLSIGPMCAAQGGESREPYIILRDKRSQQIKCGRNLPC